jgi:hypothetical protein
MWLVMQPTPQTYVKSSRRYFEKSRESASAQMKSDIGTPGATTLASVITVVLPIMTVSTVVTTTLVVVVPARAHPAVIATTGTVATFVTALATVVVEVMTAAATLVAARRRPPRPPRSPRTSAPRSGASSHVGRTNALCTQYASRPIYIPTDIAACYRAATRFVFTSVPQTKQALSTQRSCGRVFDEEDGKYGRSREGVVDGH